MRIDELQGSPKRGRGRVGLALALLFVGCACIGFACLNPRPEELPSASLEGAPGDAARSAPAPTSAGAADNNVPQDAPAQILLVPAPPEAPPPAFAPPGDAGVPDAGVDEDAG